jgi:hypothetical protein
MLGQTYWIVVDATTILKEIFGGGQLDRKYLARHDRINHRK